MAERVSTSSSAGSDSEERALQSSERETQMWKWPVAVTERDGTGVQVVRIGEVRSGRLSGVEAWARLGLGVSSAVHRTRMPLRSGKKRHSAAGQSRGWATGLGPREPGSRNEERGSGR